MKYILKKKWHPSQVEEVGHVFEVSYMNGIVYSIEHEKKPTNYIDAYPHEIALLVDAGYLEKQEDLLETVVESWNKQAHELAFGNIKEEDCPCKAHSVQRMLQGPKYDTLDIEVNPVPTLDLWTTEPPRETEFWFIEVVDNKLVVSSTSFQKWIHSFHLFHTNNCHRTQQSAEEALKRLLEKE